jgi:hypothetical protein
MIHREVHYRTLLDESFQFQHLESYGDGYVLIQEVFKQTQSKLEQTQATPIRTMNCIASDFSFR